MSIMRGCLTAFVVVAAIGAVGSCFGGGSDDKQASVSETVKEESTVSPETEKKETEKQTEEETTIEETEVNNIFHVGDVLETKNIKLSYISCGDYSDSNMFVEPAEGNKLVFFEFEFENIGNSDTSVGSFDFDCYADGYDVQQSYTATADNVMKSIATLSPKRKLNGIVVFEVPKDSESIEVEYETSFWTSDKAIFVFE